MKTCIKNSTFTIILFCISEALYAFDGSAAASRAIAKPAESAAAQSTITVISNDNVRFDIPRAIAQHLFLHCMERGGWSELQDTPTPLIDYTQKGETANDTLHSAQALTLFFRSLDLINAHQPISPFLLSLDIQQRLELYTLADYHGITAILNACCTTLFTPDIVASLKNRPSILTAETYAHLTTTVKFPYTLQQTLPRYPRDTEKTIALTPNGSTIVTGHKNGTLCIFQKDPHNNYVLMQTLHTREKITALALSSDASFLVSSEVDGPIKLWRKQDDGRYLESILDANNLYGSSLTINFNGTTIVGRDREQNIKIWHLQADGTYQSTLLSTVARIRKIHITAPIVSADGATIALANGENNIYVWQRQADGTYRAIILKGHTNYISALAMAHDGAIIVSASFDNTLRIWHINPDGTFTSAIIANHPDSMLSIAITPDAAKIISRGYHGIYHWQKTDGGTYQSTTITTDRTLEPFAVAHDGKTILGSTQDTTHNITTVLHLWCQLPDDTYADTILTKKLKNIYEAALTADGTTAIFGNIPSAEEAHAGLYVFHQEIFSNLSLAQALLIKLILASKKQRLILTKYTPENAEILREIIASFKPDSQEARFAAEHTLEHAPSSHCTVL